MNEANFITWKYKHDGRGLRSRKRMIWGGVLLLVALVSVFMKSWGLAAMTGFIGVGVFFSADRLLCLGPRYLLCGEDIVYFAAVTAIRLDERAGTLTVSSGEKRRFVLERSRFPSNARKPDKIARHRAQKFGKVAAKIVQRVRAAAPGAEIVGVSMADASNE